MAEWLIVPPWKGGIRKFRIEGSNPSPSARFKSDAVLCSIGFFIFFRRIQRAPSHFVSPCCTSKSYLGKLFVCTIAASLRLMMMSRAQTNAKTSGLKIPKDSMDVLMAKLRGIKAEKRRNPNAWVVRQLSKKQRDMLALLGLKLPPKTLR